VLRVPLVLLAGFSLIAGRLFAADWLHYRGPSANGVASESVNLPPSGAAKVLWRAKVGVGTASSVVAGGRLYTSGHEAGSEWVRCLNAATGAVVWAHHYAVSLDPNLFEGGSRSTPTISGDGLYVLSHEGHVTCLDASSGAVRWQKHLVRDFGGRKPGWGFSGAPLVDGSRVILDCGGSASSTVALDARSGQLLWKSGGDPAGYASPLILDVDGRRTLVLLKGGALVGLDPENGTQWWRHPWSTSYDVNAATPVQVAPNRLLISSGYNAGAAVVEVSSGRAQEVWRNKNLRCHINSPVLWGDVVFGVDGNTGGGNLVCLDVATGERRWEEKSVKGGAVIAAGGRLISVSEKGDLIFAEARGDAFRQLGRQTVLNQRTWAQLVLSGGRIFLRDNQGNMVCLGL